MLQKRIIPCLLLKGQGLVKGVKFSNHRYIGDPMNAVKIYNLLEADELLFFDITATAEQRIPPLSLIQKITDQSLMPCGVGGGIRTVNDARELIRVGAEKVCLNTAALENPGLISEIANIFGNQAVVVSIDYRKKGGNYETFTRCGTKFVGNDLVGLTKEMVRRGAGEIIINSIDREGSYEGYDTETVFQISNTVDVPILASGGAGNIEHLFEVVAKGHAQAAIAGSMFVFHGPRHAVLISYPTKEQLSHIRTYENQ